MIANSVALITGVSSGIGRKTAQLLAERGARVFGTVRDPSRINPIAKAEFVLMDVTDDKSGKNAVKSVLDAAGKIDILINNAGYSIARGHWRKQALRKRIFCLRRISLACYA